MPIYNSVYSMLKCSLPETVKIAWLCLTTPKPDGGCYGFPAAMLLLSLVDTVGSYVEPYARKNVERHFDVLNDASYFGLNLPREGVRSIWAEYRNLLTHHGVLADSTILRIGEMEYEPFEIDYDGKRVRAINLLSLWQVTDKAVVALLSLPPETIENSRPVKNMKRKLRKPRN